MRTTIATLCTLAALGGLTAFAAGSGDGAPSPEPASATAAPREVVRTETVTRTIHRRGKSRHARAAAPVAPPATPAAPPVRVVAAAPAAFVDDRGRDGDDDGFEHEHGEDDHGGHGRGGDDD